MRRLSHNFSWMLIGNTALAASQWAMVAILARFSTPEILGAYALGLSIAAVAFCLTNLELRTLQVTDHSSQTSFATYYRLRFCTGLATLAALGILSLVLPYSRAATLAILAVAISKCLDGLSDVIYGRLQVSDRMSFIGKSQLAKAVLSIALLAAILATVSNPLWAIAATIGPYLAVLGFYDLPNLRRYGGAAPREPGMSCIPARTTIIALAQTGVPLTIVNTMVSLHAAVPRLAVANDVGEMGVGVFAALSYLSVAPNLVVTALGQASMRSLSTSLASKDRRGFLAHVLRLAGFATALGISTILAAFFFGPAILSLFYGSRFSGYSRELILFLAAGAVGYLNAAVGYSLSSARVFGPQIPMMATVCLVSFLTSWLLVARWGIAGAALSQGISMTAQLVWSSVLLIYTVSSHFRPACSVSLAGAAVRSGL